MFYILSFLFNCNCINFNLLGCTLINCAFLIENKRANKTNKTLFINVLSTSAKKTELTISAF